jgi:hypothetical protein
MVDTQHINETYLDLVISGHLRLAFEKVLRGRNLCGIFGGIDSEPWLFRPVE